MTPSELIEETAKLACGDWWRDADTVAALRSLWGSSINSHGVFVDAKKEEVVSKGRVSVTLRIAKAKGVFSVGVTCQTANNGYSSGPPSVSRLYESHEEAMAAGIQLALDSMLPKDDEPGVKSVRKLLLVKLGQLRPNHPNNEVPMKTAHGQPKRFSVVGEECPSCRGYGHFDENGQPTIEGRTPSRRCGDCRGSGKIQAPDKSPPPGAEEPVQNSAPAAYEEEFPIRSVMRSETNPRKTFDPVELEKLAASVKVHGVLEPLLVRPLKGGRVELIAGERRLRAAEIAGAKFVPVRILDLDDKAAAEVQLVENLQRADVDPFEQADGFQSLIDEHGYTVEKLSHRLGWSTAAVYATLKLRLVPAKGREAVRDGRISISTAQLIGRVPNEALRETAAAAIVGGKTKFGGFDEPMSFQSAKEWIANKLTRELKGAPFTPESAHLTSRGACTSCPCRTGNARQLYPDGRADICTDTACFDEKVKAQSAIVLKTARAAGHAVLVGKESAKLFNEYDDHSLAFNSNYVDLDAICNEGSKPVKWSKHLLPECENNVVFAVDQKGRARRLVSASRAQRTLKAKGIGRHSETTTSENSQWKAQQAKFEKEKKHKNQVTAALAAAANEACLNDPFIDGPIVLMRAIAKAVTAAFWHDTKARYEKAHGGGLDLSAKIDGLRPTECIALICEFIVYAGLSDSGGRVSADDVAELLEALKVDRKEIEKQLEYAQVAKPAKKAKAS